MDDGFSQSTSKWPFKWPFKQPLQEALKEPPHDPATEEAMRCMEKARKSGAWELDLSNLKLSTLPESIGRLSRLLELYVSNNQLSSCPSRSASSLSSRSSIFS